MSLYVAWDPIKEAANVQKHGVDFREACTVLADPLASFAIDAAHSHRESRVLAIGMSARGQLLVVVTTGVEAGITRIIPARRPTRRERIAYEDL